MGPCAAGKRSPRSRSLPCRAVTSLARQPERPSVNLTTPTASAPLADERRNRAAWVLLANVLLLAALAGPFLTGRIYTHDDLGALHLPLRAFYAVCLAQGDRFDWLPHLFNGFYLAGEGQAGTYHPLHLVLYRWLPFETAFGLDCLWSYPWLLLGSYLLLQRRLRRRDAALYGALIFTFSGFNLLHFAHQNAIAVVAHIPWLLWAIDVALRDANRRHVRLAWVAVALLTGSQLLLGYPQYIWFSLLAEGTYAAWLLTHATGPWRGLARWTLAKLLGLAIGGVQLLPTVDALTRSARSTADADFAAWGSLAPLNVLQFVAPYLSSTRVIGENTHELGLYIGAAPLMLVVWLLIPRGQPGRMRRFGWGAAACALVALLLAFGEYGFLHRLQASLPLVGSFRFPCRAIVLVHLALAVAAACAWLDLTRRAERRIITPWMSLWPLGAAVAVSLLVALVAPRSWPPEYRAAWWLAAAGPLLVGVAALLVAAAARHVRGASVALVLFTALDLGLYGMSYGVYPHAVTLDEYVAALDLPPGKGRDRFAGDLSRFDQSTLRLGNEALLAGRRRVDGYLGLEPLRRLDYRTPAALRLSGARWARRSPQLDDQAGLIRYDRQWYAVAAPLPRARLVSKARVTPDLSTALATTPLESTALVDAPLQLDATRPGTAEVIVDRPGHIELAVESPGRQLLVLAESYHPGWRARIGANPIEVIPVNGDFLGCVVPPGRHRIVYQFQPRSLWYGGWLTLCGLAATGGLFAFELLHQRNPNPAG